MSSMEEETKEEETIPLNFRFGERAVVVSARVHGTVAELEEMLYELFEVLPGHEHLRLVYRGALLSGTDTVSGLNFQDLTAILVVRRLRVHRPVDPSSEEHPLGPGESAALTFCLPRSRSTITVSVLSSATLSEVCHEHIQPLLGIPVMFMKLICSGRPLPMETLAGNPSLADESAIHVLKNYSRENMSSRICKTDLVANCMHCHEEGVQMQLRAMCGRCGDSFAELLTDVDLVPSDDAPEGRSWESLRTVQCKCHVEDCGYEGFASIGFMCNSKRDGRRCPSRTIDIMGDRVSVRGMVGSIRPSFSHAELCDELNRILGYPAGAGFS